MRRAAMAAGLLAVTVATGCARAQVVGSEVLRPVPDTSPAASAGPVMSTGPAPGIVTCGALAASLTTDQKVGQLYMVGTTSTGVPDALASLIRDFHLGSVLYLGDRDASVSTSAAQSATIAALGEDTVPVLIAADQEGGLIQRMAGSGFSTIPSAREQGRMDPDALRTSWASWGRELARAGVRINLGPVADTVPESMISANAPIGALKRNFGTRPEDVAESVAAVVEGLAEAKIATSVKHFPGLGRVTTNTDVGVAVDDVTSADDESLVPFTAAMDAGVSSVMVSSAIYSRIDPGVPAMHSSTIVTGLLRERLGWRGVVISDDVGAAGALDAVAARDRGVRFLAAGGDLVITADPATVGDMIEGTLERAASDQEFEDGLDVHVARVLDLKASVGLVECG